MPTNDRVSLLLGIAFDGKTREVGDAIEALLSDWKGTP